MARERGVIRAWITDRGFGFLRPDSYGPDLFVHISACQFGEPSIGAHVSYEVGEGRDGRPIAVDLQIVE